jgi:hypothetical protein
MTPCSYLNDLWDHTIHSLAKWKILDSMQDQVIIQCCTTRFSCYNLCTVNCISCEIENMNATCFAELYCMLVHFQFLFSWINDAITSFSYIMEIQIGAKTFFFFVKHNILVIGTRVQWIPYWAAHGSLFCLHWLLTYCHSTRGKRVEPLSNILSQHPACPFSSKFEYLFLILLICWCTELEFDYQFCKLAIIGTEFLSVIVLLLNLSSGLLSSCTTKQLFVRRLCGI